MSALHFAFIALRDLAFTAAAIAAITSALLLPVLHADLHADLIPAGAAGAADAR